MVWAAIVSVQGGCQFELGRAAPEDRASRVGAALDMTAVEEAKASLPPGWMRPVVRDAAICLRARTSIDALLDQALQEADDVDEALAHWRLQERGVRTFCDFAIGSDAVR